MDASAKGSDRPAFRIDATLFRLHFSDPKYVNSSMDVP
jgi:hypothetical protein